MPTGSPQDKLITLISSLSSEQQSAVEAFIHYLQEIPHSPKMEVRAALDEFIHEHSELLRRLAQ